MKQGGLGGAGGQRLESGGIGKGRGRGVEGGGRFEKPIKIRKQYQTRPDSLVAICTPKEANFYNGGDHLTTPDNFLCKN